MHTLHRRIYRLLLRLHPAAFHHEFAREMALDFEEALETFGLARLLLDAAGSLSRQWSAGVFSGAPAPVSALRPSLLAGNYVMVCDRSFTALELGFGLIASAIQLALCLFALNASPGYRPDLPVMYASSRTPARHGSGNPQTPPPAGGGSGSGSKPSQSTGASLAFAQKAEDSGASWQQAAGGKMAFEVATIKPAQPGKRIDATIGLNMDDEPTRLGGRLLVQGTLPTLIGFAYKIMPTHEQQDAMLAHLPKWVATEDFVIEAKADGNPTKDQMRLMMQSLLADRFKLALHFETQEMPALALLLDKPGKTGPRLRSHAEGLPCDAKWTPPPDPTSSSVAPGGFLPSCGANALMFTPRHSILVGARGVTLQYIADYIPQWQGFGRPVVDRTGLAGTYDFSLDSVPENTGPSIPGTDADLDTGAPNFLAALKEQLGLKLQPTRARVQVLVVDHVEQPSPN
jgi:uncharacterized protein (TIGR03435 family)